MTCFEGDQKEYLSKNFNGLKYSGKKIDSTEFEDCTFKECDFSEVVFDRCKFIECHFLNCNLSIAKLKRSRFSDVVFDDCKLIGVDWTEATWPNIALFSPVKYYKCILNDSSFFGLDLKEIVMEECKAHDVDFRDGNFKDANFTYTDFSNSLFNKTNLQNSDFTEAANYQIDIYLNDIKGAKFSRYEAISLLDSLDIELVD